MTLGNIIITVNMHDEVVKHEYGHYIQSRIWGISYLATIVPLSIRAGLEKVGSIQEYYEKRRVERKATILGYKYWTE